MKITPVQRGRGVQPPSQSNNGLGGPQTVRICFIGQWLYGEVIHWIILVRRYGRVLGLVVEVSRRDLLYCILM
jgi:hypothetical protein